MKKILCIITLMIMLTVGVYARNTEPKYKIISRSYQEQDIREMYDVKKSLLNDYKIWAQGVNDKDQVLADHQNDYHAKYQMGIYTIILGEGKGKTLTGDLKVNYCESTQDIHPHSFLFDWLF